MGTANYKDISKPKKYGIVIKQSSSLDENCSKDAKLISDILMLSTEEYDRLKNELKVKHTSFVGDYYIDIAKSKLFKLTKLINEYKLDYLNIQVKGREHR